MEPVIIIVVVVIIMFIIVILLLRLIVVVISINLAHLNPILLVGLHDLFLTFNPFPTELILKDDNRLLDGK
jgi:hypothetical protein